jgi:peptidyl-prolyl cis-trans isomerase SurA
MKKQFLMKKLLILSFVFGCFIVNAQLPKDSVIMTVAGKQIPLGEFEFIAKKNNEVDFSSEESIKKYIELFKNFKLKVAEAESLSFDKSPDFIRELSGYQSELRMSCLSDSKAENEVVRAVYDRGKEYVELSQITFPFSSAQCLSKDTVEAYNRAMQVYNQIKSGKDFDELGKNIFEAYQQCVKDRDNMEECLPVIYEYVPCLLPLRKSKVFEDKAYSMAVGEISLPIRSADGFHLLKIKNRKTLPDIYRVAYLRIGFEKDSVTRTKEELSKMAEEAYNKAVAGEDFTQLIKEYSSDMDSGDGILPPVQPGQLVKPLEEVVYSLSTPGEISKPVMTEFGYHMFKLIEKKPNPSFEEEKDNIEMEIRRGDRNFDLFKSFDERLKREYNYTFFPEAYAELEKLADEYFPNSNEFFDKAADMKKTLAVINGIEFPQAEFAYYMVRFPYSVKTYANDFMREVYDLFVRDIVTTLEKENMDTKYPEIPYLVQEYRDGMLLFEISNLKIWSQPLEKQAELEAGWLKELNKKYPVEVNRKLLKKLKK